MGFLNRGRSVMLIDELLHRSLYNDIPRRLVYSALLGVLGALALIILCAPAFVAFVISDRVSAHREFWAGVGTVWVLLLLALTVVAMVVATVVGVRKAVAKNKAIKEYDQRRNHRP